MEISAGSSPTIGLHTQHHPILAKTTRYVTRISDLTGYPCRRNKSAHHCSSHCAHGIQANPSRLELQLIPRLL